MTRTRSCAPTGFCNGLTTETRECSSGCRKYTCPGNNCCWNIDLLFKYELLETPTYLGWTSLYLFLFFNFSFLDTSLYSFHCDFENTCYQMFKGNGYFTNVGQFTPSMNTGPTADNTYPTGMRRVYVPNKYNPDSVHNFWRFPLLLGDSLVFVKVAWLCLWLLLNLPLCVISKRRQA